MAERLIDRPIVVEAGRYAGLPGVVVAHTARTLDVLLHGVDGVVTVRRTSVELY